MPLLPKVRITKYPISDPTHAKSGSSSKLTIIQIPSHNIQLAMKQHGQSFYIIIIILVQFGAQGTVNCSGAHQVN